MPAAAPAGSKNKKSKYTLVDLFWVLLGIVVAVTTRERAQYLESRAFDARLQLAAKYAPVKNVSRTVLAPIDDLAVQRYGRWPWSRDRWAPVLKALAEVGVDAAAFDVEFPEKSEPVLRRSVTGKSFQELIGLEIHALEVQADPAQLVTYFSGEIETAFRAAGDALNAALELRFDRVSETAVGWLPGPMGSASVAKLASFPVRLALVPLSISLSPQSAEAAETTRLRELAVQALALPLGQRAKAIKFGDSKAEKALALKVDNPLIGDDDKRYDEVGLIHGTRGEAQAAASKALSDAAFDRALARHPTADPAGALLPDDEVYRLVAQTLSLKLEDAKRNLRSAMAPARARALTRASGTLSLSSVVTFLDGTVRDRLSGSIQNLGSELVRKMGGIKQLMSRAVQSPDDDFAASIYAARQLGMQVYGVFYTEGGLVLEVAQKESTTDAFILDLLNLPVEKRTDFQHPGRLEDGEHRILRGMAVNPMAGPEDPIWTKVLQFKSSEEIRHGLESARERILGHALDLALRNRPELAEKELLAALSERFKAPLTPMFEKHALKLLPSARARALAMQRFLLEIPSEQVSDSPTFYGFTPPILEIARVYSGIALSVMAADGDGVMRRVPLLRRVQNGVMPGVSFLLFLHALGLSTDDLPALKKAVSIRPGPVVRVETNGESVEIPIDGQGSTILRMQGEEDKLERVPLSSVIDYIRLKNSRRELQDNENPQEALAYNLLTESADDLMRGGDVPLAWPAVLEHAKTLGPLEMRLVDSILEGSGKPEDIEGTKKPSAWLHIIEVWREKTAKRNHDTLLRQVKKFRADPPEKQKAKLEKKGSAWPLLLQKCAMLEELDFVKAKLIRELKGKMVIIGAAQTGNTDLAPTPFSPKQPNYALHGHGAATLMSGNYVRRPPYRDAALIPIIAVALAVGLVLPRVKLAFGAFWTMGLIAFWAVASTLLLAYRGVWIDFVSPVIAIGSVYFGLSGWRYYTVEHSKQQYRDMFAAYLDERVIEQFVERPELFKEIGGISMEITAFFSDIEGFTTISETLTPEALSKMLEDYLTPMTDIIQGRGGLRDKYIGDAIVAMFGAPIHQPDHAIQGCLASLEQKDRLAALKKDPRLLGDPKSWLSVLNSKGRDFNARMGVNTGLAKVGNFGSSKSKNYTMIGDTVNLAARLEGANKAFGTYLMISEFTYAQAREYIEARPLDSIRVKGKLRPVTVYELMAKKGQLTQVQEDVRGIYVKARDLYLESRFEEAIAMFKKALELDPKDPPSLTLMHRSEHFIHEPPAKDWDGTYDLKEK